MKNNPSPPSDTAGFQAELDRLCRGKSLKLRIAWAPALIETKVIKVNGQPALRDYAKYPLVANETRAYIVGTRFLRCVNGKMAQVGYQKTGGVIVGDVLDTDMALPDYEEVNHSIHLFVIEEQRPDAYARRVWAKKKQLALADLGFDPYPDFPLEGVWDWYADISEHRNNCCAAAFAARLQCSGLYRDPDGRDLEQIAQRLQERDGRSPYKWRAEQMARDIRRGYEEWDRGRLAAQLQEAREIQRLAIRSIEKPAVYLDPAKRRIT